MTSKEALEKIEKDLEIENIFDTKIPEIKCLETALNRLEELERVLKIIKDSVLETKYSTPKRRCIDMTLLLTQTEYDLLKEYLK